MSNIQWIKITTDMFEDEKIDFIASLPEADAILVIWIRILTMAGRCNAGGYVFLTEKIPYTEEMLAHKFKKPINIIKLAFETFQRLEMIEVNERGIYLTNWEKHQNIEALDSYKERERIRKQEYRKKQRLLLPNGDKNEDIPENVRTNEGTNEGQSPNCPRLDIDKDLEKDLEKDIKEKENKIPSSPAAVKRELKKITEPIPTFIDLDDEPDQNMDTITLAYQKVFGTMFMNGIMTEFIRGLFELGCDNHMIVELFYEVGESSRSPNLNYLKKIADRWIQKGITTREEARYAQTNIGVYPNRVEVHDSGTEAENSRKAESTGNPDRDYLRSQGIEFPHGTSDDEIRRTADELRKMWSEPVSEV